jgi:hypothetical protein
MGTMVEIQKLRKEFGPILAVDDNHENDYRLSHPDGRNSPNQWI